MKISIAMASYNGSKHLQQQLDSFSKQQRLPDELVVCDDGSTDETVTILQEYAKQVEFDVKIIINDINLGYIKNFEKCLRLCTGDVIFLSDQDDIWFPEKLHTVTSIFSQHPEFMLVINDYFVSNADCSKRLFSKLQNAKAQGFDEDWFIAGCATALRAEFLQYALPIPHDVHGHDSWINNLAIYSNTRYLLNQPLQLYRRHDDNTTANSIVNRKVRLPTLYLLKKYGIKDNRDNWRWQIESNNYYMLRLQEMIKQCSGTILQEHSLNQALKRFHLDNAAIQKRIDMMQLQPYKRIWTIVSEYRKGFYNNFNGLKSAIKDILRAG